MTGAVHAVKALAPIRFHSNQDRGASAPTAGTKRAASVLQLEAPVGKQPRPSSPPAVPSYVSCSFPSQQQAFAYWDAHPRRPWLRCYGVELSAGGQRRFLVTTPQQLWQDYTQLLPQQRCHYEIIREASPCHLYLDVEYAVAVNPGVCGPQMVQLLVDEIGRQLEALYGIQLQPQHILELDSSTPTKFSRHLIVQLPGLAWADNGHAGRFVLLVVLCLLQRAQHSTAAAAAACVRTKEGGWTTAVDLGVYSRNRAFRLYLSSKYGRSSWLRCTPRWGGAGLTPQEMFDRSLVTFAAPPGSGSSSSSGNSSSSRNSGMSCYASSPHTAPWPCSSTADALENSSSSVTVSKAVQAAAGTGAPRVATCTQQQQQQQEDPTMEMQQHPPGANTASSCINKNRPCMSSMHSTAIAAHAIAATAAAAAAAAADVWPRRAAQGHSWQHPWLPPAQAVYCPLGRPAPTSLLHMPAVDWVQLLQALPPPYASLPMLHQPCLIGASGHSSLWPVPAPPPAAAGACVQGQAGQAGRGAAVDWGPVLPGPSPFPQVEQLLQHHCQQRGAPASVRSWGVAPQAGLLLFNMRGGRWCGNVGRQHRSNGIYFVVDANTGVFYQKCYDPECRHYRSETLPLPKDAWHACQSVFQQQQPLQGPQVEQGCQVDQPAVGCTGFQEEDAELLQLLDEVEQQVAQRRLASQQPPVKLA